MAFTLKMVKSLDRRPPTRRDYEMMAHIIGKIPAPTRKRVATHFAGWLSRYEGFDGARFLRTCKEG